MPSLRAVHESDHEIAAVVTRPPAPKGRGRELTASPIASVAQALGLPSACTGEPARPGVRCSDHRARAALLSGRRFWGAHPARSSALAGKGLAEPALLPAPLVARRSARSTRNTSWRRHHWSDDISAGRGTGHWASSSGRSLSRSAWMTRLQMYSIGWLDREPALLVHTLDAVADGSAHARAATD